MRPQHEFTSTLSHLPRQSCVLLLLAALLPEPKRAVDLMQFMDISAKEFEAALRELSQRGLVRDTKDTHRWHAVLEHEAALFSCVHSLRATAELSSLESTLLLLHEGKILDACTLLEPLLDVLTRRSHIAGASLCMDLLISQLTQWRALKNDANSRRKYIDLVITILNKALHFGLRTRQAYSLIPGAMHLADILRDKRAQSILTLLCSSLENYASEFRPDKLNESIQRGFDAAEALGDSDILMKAGNFVFTLYYARGDFAAALKLYEKTLWSPSSGQVSYFKDMYPLYICPGALYLGLYPYAIGLAEYALRQAESVNHQHNIQWWNVLLGVIFLYLRQPDKALPHLARIMDCLDEEADPKIALWATRALAYYHYLQGRPSVSYNIFRRCLEQRERKGYSRFSYTAPWILELFGAYDKAGFPPLPGFPLAEELAYAQNGSNKLLNAMALRIRAQKEELAGESPQKIREKLEQSLSLFSSAGEAIESARAKLELASFLRRHGKLKQAKHLYTQGEDFLRMLQGGAKGGKKTAAATDAPAAEWQGSIVPRQPATVIDTCEESLANAPSDISSRQALQRLVHIVQRELGAERAALFHRNAGGGHAFICGSNCTEDDYATSSKRVFVEDMFTHFDAANLQSFYIVHGGTFSLALRLAEKEDVRWGLLLESAHVAGDFACLAKDERARLARLLARELSAADKHPLYPVETAQEGQAHATASVVCGSLEDGTFWDSPGLRFVVEQASHIASTDVPVLLLGETGVGKEVMARLIHRLSGRGGAFVAVHPASTAESLFESEFFGHEKGAFTGADKQKPGLFELADAGTLFVDEVGEISSSMQVKLLRVLQDKSFLRVGGVRLISSDFRLIAATNRNLQQEVINGNFREDLYYRISVMPLMLPPLRARIQDIEILAQLFIKTFAQRYGKKIPPLTPEALADLMTYPWPGNVRELKNIMERAVLLNRGGSLHFSLNEQQPGNTIQPSPPSNSPSLHYDTPSLETLERRYIEHILQRTGGKVSGPQGAAALLGMKRSTLYAKIRQFDLGALLVQKR
ncbi:MAG: sigma 54-interacting transcriptional regulator [Desulfovibrionaceae bacterium]|nr:sigma 54-interacting transcriptional regulator [Desulfovibrionaceae bacterium]